MEKLRAQVAQEEQATFAPQINPSAAGATATGRAHASLNLPLELVGQFGGRGAWTRAAGRAMPASERLAADAALAAERRAQRELQRREEEELACPFQPEINKARRRALLILSFRFSFQSPRLEAATLKLWLCEMASWFCFLHACQVSARILEVQGGARGGPPPSFFERAARAQERSEEKAEKMRAEAAEAEAALFKPAVSQARAATA